MPAYRARAEFRRASRSSPWVLAGVRLGDLFLPAVPGVEPVRRRLPDAGLLGWSDLEQRIVAPDRATAAETALALARGTWPHRVDDPVPFASGGPEP